VRLTYTEIHAPIDGIVDVRAPRCPVKVVTAGQPVVTLINQDDLWVRVDIEEDLHRSRCAGRRQADRAPALRAPSARARSSNRAADAGLRHSTRCEPHQAGHQDVRSLRLRLDNKDRRLAVGHDGIRVVCRSSPEPKAKSPEPMTNAIEVRDIVKKFGDFTAVDGINFEVKRARSSVCSVPNGAGKSTLIRMMVTLLPPTSGTATDQRLRRRQASRRRPPIDRRDSAGDDQRPRADASTRTC
jgi:ATPase subunit of ABC transporter with duplicated ATPase domains